MDGMTGVFRRGAAPYGAGPGLGSHADESARIEISAAVQTALHLEDIAPIIRLATFGFS
jgi:hypothetical protein